MVHPGSMLGPSQLSPIHIQIKGWNKSLFSQSNIHSFDSYLCKTTPSNLPPVTHMDCAFFNITPKEAVYIDPQQRWLLEASVEAIQNTGLPCLPQTQECSLDDQLSGYLTTGTNSSVLAGRLSHFLGLTGPTQTFDTGCSSFSTALIAACESLKNRKCSFALVGAVNCILNKKTTVALEKAKMLSGQHKCASFDASADGYLRGEAVVVLLLEGVKQLNGSGLEIAGWSSGHNGGTNAGLTVPCGEAQQRVMLEALEMSGGLDGVDLSRCMQVPLPWGILLRQLLWCRQELTVTKNVDRNLKKLTINASKTHFGHCEAAAGGVGLVQVLQALETGYLTAVNHFQLLNSQIRNGLKQKNVKLVVPVVSAEMEHFNKAMINSFGFSGVNTCVIVQNFGNDEDEASGEVT
uniref:Ketosynthase family 3 (KS3) domain-containing protein n=1 Tax=Ditylenchus dipsaci TaxID=166011 RepID=A0A915DTM7_9BILA